MDTTPRSKVRKLSCRKTESEIDCEQAEPWAPSQPFVDTACTSTPPHRKGIQFEHDNESPMYFPLTQEGSEEMDVVWDWNSPQENKRKRRVPRPLSPKVPIKRHPSSSQTLEKLESELRALREQLAESFDETLHVSPHQEEEILQSQNKVVVEDKELDLLLDDSLDEQLIQCTQQVETQFQAEKPTSHNCDIKVLSGNNNGYEHSMLNTSQNQTKKPLVFQRTRSNEQYSKPQIKVEFNRTKSFEEPVKTTELPKDVLDQIEKKKLEALARLEAKRKNTVPVQTLRFSQTEMKSQDLAKQEVANVKAQGATPRQQNTSNASRVEIGREAFQQTSSTFHQKFPSSSSAMPSEVIGKNENESKCSLEEIEKKRLQALVKRQAVGASAQITARPPSLTTSRIDTSARQASMKCSPEEIEKKRLQAMARREEKKIQDLIERKRQEALKRLHLNKQKQNKHI